MPKEKFYALIVHLRNKNITAQNYLYILIVLKFLSERFNLDIPIFAGESEGEYCIKKFFLEKNNQPSILQKNYLNFWKRTRKDIFLIKKNISTLI